MPRFALPDEDAAEESSDAESAEEEEEAAHGGEDAAQEDEDAAENTAGPSSAAARPKISLKLGQGKLTCHVCGKAGHNAGFVGALYIDCPNRPCYLCKLPGHTTATCPYRYTGDEAGPSASTSGVLAGIRKREVGGRPEEHPHHKLRWQVDAAVLKLHSRRCTCLEFHPFKDNLVLSGDKKGQIAIWDWERVHERSVYKPHGALTNNIRFLPGRNGTAAVSCGTDGKLKTFDIETGMDTDLLNLNPDGWVEGVTNERTWNMLYGMDVCGPRELCIAGDTRGNLHFADPRDASALGVIQAHKKGNKVNSIHCNPRDANMMATASNDWTVRVFDLRCMPTGDQLVSPARTGRRAAELPEGFEVASLAHPKVVNSAYFSPVSGTKLLSTCIDNRLRVWDSWLGQSEEPSRQMVHSHDFNRDSWLGQSEEPSRQMVHSHDFNRLGHSEVPFRQMVHSHDFNRYLTPMRAEWDPKDSYERMIVVGRYISEVYGGLALHPVDLMDAGTGRQLAALTDPNLTTISPVNKPHPRQDVIISGSSRSLYAWKPVQDEEVEEALACKAALDQAPLGSKNFIVFDSLAGDDDDDEDGGKTKKKKARSKGTDADADASKSKKRKS